MKRTLYILIIFSLMMVSFQCKFLEEFIDSSDDFGDYTRVELRIKVIFSGLNSSGIRTVTIDNVEELEEDFYYDQSAGAADDCDTAEPDISHTFDVTITDDNFRILLEYLDWDYVHYSFVDDNYKVLCSEWSARVISYEYEEGMKDPGEPLVTGLENLELERDKDCDPEDERVDDCQVSAIITLERDG
jgi:hypothetical protein